MNSLETKILLEENLKNTWKLKNEIQIKEDEIRKLRGHVKEYEGENINCYNYIAKAFEERDSVWRSAVNEGLDQSDAERDPKIIKFYKELANDDPIKNKIKEDYQKAKDRAESREIIKEEFNEKITAGVVVSKGEQGQILLYPTAMYESIELHPSLTEKLVEHVYNVLAVAEVNFDKPEELDDGRIEIVTQCSDVNRLVEILRSTKPDDFDKANIEFFVLPDFGSEQQEVAQTESPICKEDEIVNFHEHELVKSEYDALTEIARKYFNQSAEEYFPKRKDVYFKIKNQHVIRLDMVNQDLDEIPASINKLTQLQILYLYNNKISGIKNLDGLTQLQELSLRNNKIPKIENLDRVIQLQKLWLYDNQISKIENLDGLTQLQTLYLGSNQISKIENLDSLAQLKELQLYKNQISTIENLDKLIQLKELSLGDNQISQIENLDSLTQLQKLWLYKNQISKIENLDKLTQLQILSLGSNQISKIEYIDRLTQLQLLSLGSNQISKIEYIDRLTQLQELKLWGNQISKIENVDELNRLQKLKLENNQIDYSEPLNKQELNKLRQKGVKVRTKFKYMSVKQAAKFLNCSNAGVQYRIEKKDLEAEKVKNKYRISVDSVEELKLQREQKKIQPKNMSQEYVEAAEDIRGGLTKSEVREKYNLSQQKLAIVTQYMNRGVL